MQNRTSNGQFASKWKRRTLIVFILLAVGAATVHYTYIEPALGNTISAQNFLASSIAFGDETMESKVEDLKEEIVERLKGCESPGYKENDAPMILDTNNEFSIGRLMFQIKTVQHYEKILNGNDITRKEAILIALDEAKATQLAHDIIFKEKGGIWNWKNCADKLNLAPEIEVVKKLTQ